MGVVDHVTLCTLQGWVWSMCPSVLCRDGRGQSCDPMYCAGMGVVNHVTLSMHCAGMGVVSMTLCIMQGGWDQSCDPMYYAGMGVVSGLQSPEATAAVFWCMGCLSESMGCQRGKGCCHHQVRSTLV